MAGRVKLGPYNLNEIYTGDARELAKSIPDESVDLIFTDPVYDRIDDYRWLAETAARVLRPDRALLTFYGIGYAPQTHDALRSANLNYKWRFVIRSLFGKGSGQWLGRLQAGTKELLWYEKGHSKIYQSVFDLRIVSHNRQATRIVNGRPWGKHIEEIDQYIMSFSCVNDIIIDFFAGDGSTAAACKMLDRNYLAFEICPETAAKARERVLLTQPPLFVPEPEQLELWEVDH